MAACYRAGEGVKIIVSALNRRLCLCTSWLAYARTHLRGKAEDGRLKYQTAHHPKKTSVMCVAAICNLIFADARQAI